MLTDEFWAGHHSEGHRSPRDIQGLHCRPLSPGLQDAPISVQVSSSSNAMSQGHLGTPNTSGATSCLGWRVLIHSVPNPTQPCRSPRKGPGKLHCQTHKSGPNEHPWIPRTVEWPRRRWGGNRGRAMHHQWLVYVLVVQCKITFVLNVRSIGVGLRLSDKIMQRFGVVRAKPVTAESSLIHPDWRKIFQVDSCLDSGGISLLFHNIF